uniref:Uncharacterized protein n=1 Tax=viral metagenome TaxID=1070528 RepID=A0A6C0EFR0_9ZZZZ
MSTQQNRGKTPLSSILHASQNNNASKTNILKLTQENIRSTIPNESDYRRNTNSAKNSEYSIPIYDTMSIASTRSRSRSRSNTANIRSEKNDDDDDNISVLSFNSTYTAKTSNSERFNDDEDDNVSVVSFQSSFSEYTNNDNKTITKDILEKSKKTISNLPTDIYKLLKTFHNTKDDVKYRSKFQIPSEFNVYYYLLRYPRFGNIYDYNYKKVVGLYKHYYEVSKKTHTLDDKYYRIRYSIPDIFNYETYYERYQTQLKNKGLKSDNISVYRYYYRHGFKTFPLDTLYLRLYMKIHKYFDIQILFKRYSELKDYEETFNTSNEIEVYNFYNSINKDKFCLDDQYFRLFFHIPNDFEIKTYVQRYKHISEISSLGKQEDCETYAYFEKTGKMQHTIDEKYYFILNSLPDGFDCISYKKRYIENFEESDGYQKITAFYGQNKDSHGLDEQYFEIKYNIQGDFNWKKYGEAFFHYFENMDDAKNMDKMHYLYSQKFHEKYEKKIYDHYLILKNDLSSVDKELYNKLYLFMFNNVDDEMFNSFSDWKLTYSNIYSAMLNGKMKDECIFRTGMSLLLRKCDFTNERDYRVFIKMNDFLNTEQYYQQSNNIKYITEHYIEKEFVETKPIYRRHLVEQAIEECSVNKTKNEDQDQYQDIDKNRLDELIKIINKDEQKPNNPANNAANFSALGALNLGKVISTMRDKRINKNNVPKKEEQPQDTNDNSKSKVNSLLEKITSGMKEGNDLQTITNELKQDHSS